jgi:hypothetical protein
MRSDAAPAVRKGSSSQFGIVEVDGTTITESGGVISASSSGAGTVTSVALAPGFALIPGTHNTGADEITTTGTINGQLWPVLKTSGSPYSVLSADTGNFLLAGAASYTFKAPNPASGTKGVSYTFGSDGTNGFTLTTASGTALIYGCTGAGSGVTSLVLEANLDISIVDDGTNYKCSIVGSRTQGYALTWAPGLNPNSLPIYTAPAGRTITSITCRPEALAGGTATITVKKAASGTALSAGTTVSSTPCDANASAWTVQSLGVASSALAANDTVGIVTTGTTIWTSSGVAAGMVQVNIR